MLERDGRYVTDDDPDGCANARIMLCRHRLSIAPCRCRTALLRLVRLRCRRDAAKTTTFYVSQQRHHIIIITLTDDC